METLPYPSSLSCSPFPVFHVSQLKKAVGVHQTLTAVPPSSDVQWSVPEQILQRRVVCRGTDSVLQGLIKWSAMPESLATWEDLASLRQQFPRARVWGQPGAQEGGDVSTSPDDEQAKGDEEGRRPRPSLKNVRFYGPEWNNV